MKIKMEIKSKSKIENSTDILKYKSLNLFDNRCKKLQIKKSIQEEELKFIDKINLQKVTTNSRISDDFLLTINDSSIIYLANFIINFINKNKHRSKYQIFARCDNTITSTSVEKSTCNELLLSKLFNEIKYDIKNIEIYIKFYKPKNYRNQTDMDIDF